jgi:hypothetical protein
MNSNDLGIFEQEAIQMIIDFKWFSYAKKFFFIKFFIYCIFIITFYIDLGSLNHPENIVPDLEDKHRHKDFWYGLRKVIGMSIQFLFLSYEFVQFKQEGNVYWQDLWNIFELLGIFCYFFASILDLVE